MMITASARPPEKILREDESESAASGCTRVALAEADMSIAGLTDELEEMDREAVANCEAEPDRGCNRDAVRDIVGERDWDLE